ncbi:MAG: CD1871A family CXXC motif-containing protein [Candidatus Ozemobacteraceae bacterium]
METLPRPSWPISGIVLLVIGLAITAFGVWRGDAAEVLLKATTVCLQCIGIG